MKLLRSLIHKMLDRKVQQPEAVPTITGEEFVELIKNPEKISSKLVKKVVLNGLIRLEKEGYDPFCSTDTQPPEQRKGN
ncbi:hypothetical protein EHB58_09610 [Salmonella enterica subsp. enterica serovar Hull]|uniref:Uncharacterized protein n=1 Tax=Salmonella enterica subsp. enterica serovar Hull TaxID=1403564 RepID=A0A5X4PE25_SALET|nr:hypothetical protein [Salmonella enterica subsp. enterica serovar Hull]EBZ8648468.1 hypothetical protein [Salmonella enterica subsp. enterica serovar Hull]EDH1765022.1 hypothetical protein [Salmonella enterica]